MKNIASLVSGFRVFFSFWEKKVVMVIVVAGNEARSDYQNGGAEATTACRRDPDRDCGEFRP